MLTSSANTATAAIILRVEDLSDGPVTLLHGPSPFQDLGQTNLVPILMEIATLGQKGLPVNDLTQKNRLRSLAGESTALQLGCLLPVGIKQLDPSQGSSFGIDKEWEAALAVYRYKGSTSTA